MHTVDWHDWKWCMFFEIAESGKYIRRRCRSYMSPHAASPPRTLSIWSMNRRHTGQKQKSSQKSDSCCTQLKETEFSSKHEICFPKENGQRSLNHLSSSTYPHQQGLTNWQWYTGLPSTCELYCVLQGPCGALHLTKSRVPSCKTDPLANSEFDPQEQHGNTYATDLLFAVYLIPVSISLQLLSRR